MQLGEAGNTYNIALYEIEKRNYKLQCEYDEFVEWSFWLAEKGDIKLKASCPLSLLALVVVADKYGKNWINTTHDDIYQRIAFAQKD